ncbi:unnamed protein product [Cuscuta europaea]|uniref:Uncharacterized protein n=1 Tax=Cuscuta europaea TaxID=41803 RepID=A0A9P0ZCD9_CUSEU|nr:unnamed protein product [Cuscuta europaea]
MVPIDGRSMPSDVDLTASLDEEHYPFDEEDTSPRVKLNTEEDFIEEMEDTSDYRTEDDEGCRSGEACSTSSGEDKGDSGSPLKGDGASSSSAIPCPPPLSAIHGDAPRKMCRRRTRKGLGPRLSQLDLTNLHHPAAKFDG